MNSEIDITTSSYGQPSSLADSLVVDISASRISFQELDSKRHQPLFVCHYPIETTTERTLGDSLHQAIRHFQFHQKKYEGVYINYFSAQFTLCPSHFYDVANNRKLLEFNVGDVGPNFILVDEINSDIKLLYAIEEGLKSTLDTLFPNHQLKHNLTVLSRLMLQTDELVKEDVLLHINSNYIEVVYKQNHQLILANQFAVKTQEDVLYYVLFLLEQYQLNPLFVSICVIGNIETTSPLLTTLKKYIKNIHLARGHKSLNWQSITGMPQHFNYTLLNRLFCE